MRNIMRDVGTQSYAWNGLAGWLAWLGDQQNLVVISMALGILTAIINMWSKFQEYKVKRLGVAWSNSGTSSAEVDVKINA